MKGENTMRFTDYANGLETLKKNEWYWKMDSEYNIKYRMLFDYDKSTKDTREYLEDVMAFMLYQSKKIFG